MTTGMPAMPFSTVFEPVQGSAALVIPEGMRNHEARPADRVAMPPGVVQVVVSWSGRDGLDVRHHRSGGGEVVASIPASDEVQSRTTGVLALTWDEVHTVSVERSGGGSWDAATISGGHVAGAQIIPMSTPMGAFANGVPLTVDESVGTRVMLGNIMVSGDTGWRDISADLYNDWTGQVWIRRRGGNVTVLVKDLGDGISTNVFNLRDGFRSPVYGFSGLNYGSPYPLADAASPTTLLGGYLHVAGSGYIVRARLESGTTHLQGDASWTTNDPWPNSLPGIPG